VFIALLFFGFFAEIDIQIFLSWLCEVPPALEMSVLFHGTSPPVFSIFQPMASGYQLRAGENNETNTISATKTAMCGEVEDDTDTAGHFVVTKMTNL